MAGLTAEADAIQQHVRLRLEREGWRDLVYIGPGRVDPLFVTLRFHGWSPTGGPRVWELGVRREDGALIAFGPDA